jgi:hypothetical protein
MLEYWEIGFWEFGLLVSLVKTHYKKIENWTLTSYPIIPSFRYSNIPIGAKPLNS